MASTEITTDLWLCVDAENRKVRLSINNGHIDLACRKEFTAKLQQFISNGEGQLFKGRLQLYKEADTINILLKKQPVGQISTDKFLWLLNSI